MFTKKELEAKKAKVLEDAERQAVLLNVREISVLLSVNKLCKYIKPLCGWKTIQLWQMIEKFSNMYCKF